ncbi:MAG TPA: TlpA disulfide reductase family protein [Synergistaceae bacterium]|nr:TlpA disulfide reductase family protein [Synergistaceae bacterium]
MKKFGFAMMLGILGLALVGGGVFAAEVPLEGYALHSAPGGTMIATEDLLGSPVLLIFFTPNCPACEKELKSLDSQWRGFEEKWGVKVLPVAPGVLKDQASRLAEFVRQRWGVATLQVYVDGEPQMMEAHNVEYVPTLVLYDKEGKQVWKETGAVPVASLEKIFEEKLR